MTVVAAVTVRVAVVVCGLMHANGRFCCWCFRGFPVDCHRRRLRCCCSGREWLQALLCCWCSVFLLVPCDTAPAIGVFYCSERPFALFRCISMQVLLPHTLETVPTIATCHMRATKNSSLGATRARPVPLVPVEDDRCVSVASAACIVSSSSLLLCCVVC